MKPTAFMLIAGEPSGDLLAAELVLALKSSFARAPARFATDAQPLTADLAPVFFGAGGPQMAAAGVELALDLTRHSVIGLSDVLKEYRLFRRVFDRLLALACEREPDAIICVDFSGFNRRFAHAVRRVVRRRGAWFRNWNPRIVQYVSPQVWASRPGRARQLAEDIDLLLSIIPFEKAWYAERAPRLRVEFVGHPIVDRHGNSKVQRPEPKAEEPTADGQRPGSDGRGPEAETGRANSTQANPPLIVLLPGSRRDELRRHVPLLLAAAKGIAAARPVRFRMILPARLGGAAGGSALLQGGGVSEQLDMTRHSLTESLVEASLAITKSGTITLECAWFGVPAVVFYKTSWPTYCAGRLAVKTRYIAMPNLLVERPVYPEFIQRAATAENLARAALELLGDAGRRQAARAALVEVAGLLGAPGASDRAARAVWALLAERDAGSAGPGKPT